MKYLLELLSGSVTMYRMLLLILLGHVGLSILFAAFGVLPYSPLSLLLSAAVLMSVSYGSNWLIGRALKARPHGESALITGLLLLFILTPREDITGLLMLAVAALIATASKYVLVYKRRHIFNPAAAGALIAGLFGIAYGTWWVATPELFIFTALGAFLLLYKMRRLQMAAVFLAVAIPLIVTMAVVTGQSLALAMASLLSWPVVFFVGFMLSEPLTLPPRKHQQFFNAVLAGVLFALPVHLGTISSSPELTLVIVNLIAFAFSVKGLIILKLKDKRQLTPTSVEYIFEPQRPLAFEAGQYAELMMQHHADSRGQRRMLSVVSAPGEHTVRFGVKHAQQGSSFKKQLKKLRPGDVIKATTLAGDFVLPKNRAVPLLFIAGGIGITPYLSHLSWLSKQQEKRDVVLVYAATSADELAYLAELRQLPIKLIAVIPEGTVKGVDTATSPYVTQQILHDMVPNLQNRQAYVSGPPLMVQAIKKALKAEGVKKAVKTDYFTGY
ncbi:MAG TPA: hypothetical protein VFZ48_03435 [Candidatus Saccharimonadales bacterium]